MSRAEPFELTGRVYDLLYGGKDYAAESDYLVTLLERHHGAVVSILDLGCGTGRHANQLIRRGFEVTGIERSAEMARRAREVEGLRIVEGDIREVRLEKRFDAAVALFHVVSYQATVDDLTRAFRTAAAHLEPGGLFVFDVWSTPAVLIQRAEERVQQMVSSDLIVTRTARPVERPHDSIVEVHYQLAVKDRQSGEVQEIHETHIMRHLTRGEVELLAALAGFDVLHSEEYLSGAEPSESTWGVCYVLRRGH